MTTPALDEALAAGVATVFYSLMIEAPGFTLAFLDSASEVTFQTGVDGEGAPIMTTFRGSDPTYGTLGSVTAITEGIGTEAPRMKLEIRPPSRAAAATLNAPANQGARVRLWFGAVHMVTGAVIDPSLEFIGALDVPTYMGGKARRVEYNVNSAWEALFVEGEGERLNHDFWTSIFPGEMGCEFVSDVERQLPWGADVPKSPAISSAQQSYGGGGGSGGGSGVGGSGYGGYNLSDIANLSRNAV